MRKEKIINTLTDLGLKKTEAKVYFYLAKKGPKQAKEIVKAVGVTKQRLYPILKALQSKAVINASLDRPATFSAISYERLLDLFAKTKLEEAKIIEANKNELLLDWKYISALNKFNSQGKFSIIKGHKYVFSKIKQMIEETECSFSVISDISDLFRVDQFGVLESITKHPLKSKIEFHILTEINEDYFVLLKEFLKSLDEEVIIRGRNTNLELSIFPRMIIRDKKEILYFISQQKDEQKSELVCMLTDCPTLVKQFSDLFDNLWSKSPDIFKKISQIQNGSSAGISEIEEQTVTLTTVYEKLSAAKNEIIMTISSEDLLNHWKNPELFQNLTKTGTSIKIMVPISRANLKAYLDLSKTVEIRHVPAEYVKTIIIDQKDLFQFKVRNKIQSTNKTKHEQIVHSKNLEHVIKSHNMLIDIWMNSVIPSASTVESIVAQQLSKPKFMNEKKPKKKSVDIIYNNGDFYQNTKANRITEREIIDEIKNYKLNSKDCNSKKIVLIGKVGYAIIRNHCNFNYPNLLIGAYKIENCSTFGPEDAIMFSLWLKNPSGFRFVPVAIVGNNPKATNEWKKVHEGTTVPASNNYHLFKKDELHIQVHGNTFFAGWTKPIPLLPKYEPLSPSAVILEASGQIRSREFNMTLDNGIKQQQKLNYSDAIVSFILNKSKYQGPSTDGLMVRELYHVST